MSPRSGAKLGSSNVATAMNDSATTGASVSLRKSHEPLKNIALVSDPGSNDSRFVLPKCKLPPPEEFQPVEIFVANAISARQGQTSDSNRGYQSVLQALRRRDDPLTLRKVLLAIRTAGNGSTLHHLTSSSTRHAHLMHLVFRLDPFSPPSSLQRKGEALTAVEVQMLTPIWDYSLADAHLHLLLAIVSANSVFLTPGLNALWRMTHFDLEDTPTERAWRVHAAIATMLRLCPKGTTEFFPIVAANFPFRTRPVGIISWYAKQCLYVLEYVPSMHGQILELLIDKCLEIDVEIKIGNEGQVSVVKMDQQNDEDEEEEGIFQLDLDDTDAESMKDNSAEVVDETAEKVDSLLLLTFEHIHSMVNLRPEAAHVFYQILSRVFDSSILTTHRSKFVQFVILFVCGIEHETEHNADLYREFAAKLINIVMDPYRATLTRQSGSCYLASFISRASYVCPETACESVSALLRWAEVYLQSPNGHAARNAVDLHDQCELHSLFYTVCQSAFYIMCFRGVEAIKYYRAAREYHFSRNMDADDTGEDSPFAEMKHIDIGQDRWNLICGHELQPLRFCLESVRGEFLHVAGTFQLLRDPLLQKLSTDDAKRSTNRPRQAKAAVICTAATLARRRMKGGVGGLGRGSNPLDSFFPFDPYLLRQSFRFIEPMYRNWEGSLEVDDFQESGTDELADDESQSESNTSDEDDEEESKASHMTLSVDSNTLPQGMSHASNTTIASVSTKSSYHYGSPDGVTSRHAPREAWGNILKRSRAPSIENGSW